MEELKNTEATGMEPTPQDIYTSALSNLLTKWEGVAGEALTRGIGKEAAIAILYIEMTKQIVAQVNHDVPIMESRGIKQPACKPGCWWCCTGKVTVTVIEVIALAMHIKKSGKDFTDILAELEKFNIETEEAWAGDIVKRDKESFFTCPLLVKNKKGYNCGVHEFKPIPCRSFFAPDKHKCEVAFRKRKKGQEALAPYFPQFMHVSSSMMTGLVSALKTMGLEWRPLELTKALKIALSYEPADLIKEFWAGTPIFAPAYDEIPELPKLKNERDLEKLEAFVNDLAAERDKLR